MSRVRGQRSVEGLLVDWSIEQPMPDRRLPVSLLTKAQKAAELRGVQARKAMDAAYEAELVLGLADDTPDTLDPPPDQPGARKGSWAPEPELPGVSRFFSAEPAVVLNCGRRTASNLAQRAWTYRAQLPATWTALAEGALDEPRAKVLVDVLQSTAPAIARQVEAPAAARGGRPVAGAAACPGAGAAARTRQRGDRRPPQTAEKQADVRSHPSHLEGMSTLAADLPTPVSVECSDTVDRLASMLKADGDPRPIGQLRAAVLADLIRRPWDTGLPAVTAHLTITAALSALSGRTDQPGEVNGQPITAAHVRGLLAQLGALGLRTPEGGTLTLALTDPDGALRATTTLDRLARLARRGCPDHPHQDCGCPVLDRPPSTDGYTPTAAQHAFLTTRDRACRLPNCGQRAGWADRDHVIPHAHGGETDCANLCCLCRSHHRRKTHARGWRFVMDPDGTLHVTNPSGVTHTTRPPGMHPPAPDPPAMGSDPPDPHAPDDDPPPS